MQRLPQTTRNINSKFLFILVVCLFQVVSVLASSSSIRENVKKKNDSTSKINILASDTQHSNLPKLDNPMSVEYLKKHLRQEFPRLGYTQKSIKVLKRKVKTDSVMKNMYDAIKKNAESIYDEPLLKRVVVGRRLLATSRELLYRINILGFVYLMEEDDKTLARINQELVAVCSFSDWNQSHFLDVGEMAMGVALGLDWTQGKLPASSIELAKTALKEKAINKTWHKNGKIWGISKVSTNWNQVCSGGLIAASLAIADDEPELASKTISRALNGLPNALVAYGPDGVYPEGSTYWGYATRYSVATIVMFESAFGTDFGYYDIPGFKESAMFRLMCNTPTGRYFNYSDCDEHRFAYGDEVLAWFAMKSGNSAFFEKEWFLKPVDEMGKLPRFSGLAMSWLAKYKEKQHGKMPTIWRGKGPNPIAIFRSEVSDTNQLYLGCKGGRASISHGNMDAGSFVFELNGVRWSIDIPKEDYHELEKTGFNLWRSGQNAERWKLQSKNNFGHSTITVNNQLFNHDAFVPLTSFEDGDQPRVSFDLSPVYGDNIGRLRRSFQRTSNTSMEIEDEIEISEKTELITWQMVTTADINLVKGSAILSQDGKQLKVQILSHPELSFSVISLNPAPLKLDGKIEGLKRLEIQIPAWYIKNGKTKLKVRLSKK